MRRNDLAHDVEAKTREPEQQRGLKHVPGGIGRVLRGERQQLVEGLGEQADKKAEERRNAHAEIHVPGNGFKRHVVFGFGPEGEIRQFDAHGKKRTHGGQLHADGEPGPMGLTRGGDGHGLGHEAVEKRHARDGHGPDHIADHDERHPGGQAAKLGQLGRTGRVQQAAGAHEEQALIKDMGVSMGTGSVHGHGRADTDAADHVPDLGDDVVGKDAPGVVFDGRVKDAVERHDAAANGEQIETDEAPGQHIHGGLGGKGAHEDGAGDRGFGVGVRQPGVQGHKGGIDQETDQNDVVEVLGGIRRDRREGEGVQRRVAQQQAGQQKQPAEGMEEKIPEPGGRGHGGLTQPDEEHRADAHEFPEDEQAQVVAGEHATEGTGHVETGGHVLPPVGHMQGVDEADKRLNGKDMGEDQGQRIHPAEGQRLAEIGNGGQFPGAARPHGQRHHRGDGHDGRGQKQPAPDPVLVVFEKGQGQGQGQKGDGGVEEVDARKLVKTGHWYPPPDGPGWDR